jgi:L-malate glycosyltransferase
MLTVLMATYNGARTLPIVLDAYGALETPRGGWKLIIVDNASTDTTKQVIGSFVQKLPLTYLSEPKRGKNAALNTGLSHIEGDLVVLTDDDTVPHPDWLVELRKAADSHPSFAMFGGVVLPRWEVSPQPWILNWVRLDVAYALTDPSLREGPIPHYWIFEPNSAYRAQIFEAGYRFDPTIGPSGSSYAMGSGSEFHLRLAKAGFTAWHCKGAVVEHMVRKAQMQKDWVLRRAFLFGRGQYRHTKDTLGSPRLLLGIPRYFLREIMEQSLRVAKAKLTRDEGRMFAERWELNFLIGKAYEARMVSRLAGMSN